MSASSDYAPFPICLDAYADKGTVKVQVEAFEDVSTEARAYALDTAHLAALCDAANSAAPRTERTGAAAFVLSAEAADTDRLVVSSVPFDAGWHVKAEGKDLPLKMIHNSVLGFILPAGCESAAVFYRPYGGTAGLALSCISLLFWLVLWLYERKGNRK